MIDYDSIGFHRLYTCRQMLFQGHPIQSSIPLSPIPFCSAYLPTGPLTTGSAATLAVGEADAEDRVARKGAAFSLGQVKGKFVANRDLRGWSRERGKGEEKERGKEEDKRRRKDTGGRVGVVR